MLGRQLLSAWDTCSSMARKLARCASRDGLFRYAKVHACSKVSDSACAEKEIAEYNIGAHNAHARFAAPDMCPEIFIVVKGSQYKGYLIGCNT
jgi:hypothetical protein